jgi:hypothetical protein
MKVLMLLFLIPYSAQAEEVCLENNTGLETAQDLGCEGLKSLSCVHRKLDTDLMRRRISNMLAVAEKEQDKIQKYWKQYQGQPLTQLFHFDPDLASAQLNYRPVPLLDWFTREGLVAGVEKDNVQAAMIERYVAFADKHDCVPVVKHRYTTVSYPANARVENLAALDALANAPGYKAEKDQYFRELNARAAETGLTCDESRMDRRQWEEHSSIFPPCSGNLSGVFRDNSWKNSSIESALTSQHASEVMACIRDRVAKGAQIHHIGISSSANALNNTGAAVAQFCPKGFLGLSRARAESTRDTILPQLFADSGVAAAEYLPKVRLNFSGSNGDGTSGPCPYQLVNGREVLRPEYASEAGRRSLDEHKFVRIHVTFDSMTQKVSNPKKYFHPGYRCRSIYFECAPLPE